MKALGMILLLFVSYVAAAGPLAPSQSLVVVPIMDGEPSGSDARAGMLFYDMNANAFKAIDTEGEPVIFGIKGTNAVVSGGSQRIEHAQIDCNTSSSSIITQSGNWITNIGNRGSVGCSITIATGVFSGTPSCTLTRMGAQSMPGIDLNSATSISVYMALSAGSVFNDFSGNLICVGPQ